MPQWRNIFKRRDSWYVRFNVNGREVWRSAGGSKQAAQELLGKLRGEAERSAMGLPRSIRSSPTLKAWAPKYMAWAKQHKRSWDRDKLSLTHLEPVLGHLRLAEITKPRVEAYMRDRVDQVSPATVNREVACLRKLLSHAVDAGQMDSNPLRRIQMLRESPARKPVLSDQDEERLLEACQPWLRAVVEAALLTGCRQGELRDLRWRHVDLDQHSLVVVDSKTGAPRDVPLHAKLEASLRERRGLPDGYVFTLPDGKPIAKYTCSQAFRRVARKLGLPIRFHDLRHVAGTRLLAAGANLPEVADFLGHKTLVMARRYAHTSRTRLRDLVGRMGIGN